MRIQVSGILDETGRIRRQSVRIITTSLALRMLRLPEAADRSPGVHRYMRDLIAVAFMVLAAGAPAFAQDQPLAMNFGGGVAFPITGVNDAFNTGWNWTPWSDLERDAENRHPGRVRATIGSAVPSANSRSARRPRRHADDPTGLIQSNHQMHTGTFNVIYRPEPGHEPAVARRCGLYLLGGAGIYHRLVQLTSPSIGYTSVCNPYWYICYPTSGSRRPASSAIVLRMTSASTSAPASRSARTRSFTSRRAITTYGVRRSVPKSPRQTARPSIQPTRDTSRSHLV